MKYRVYTTIDMTVDIEDGRVIDIWLDGMPTHEAADWTLDNGDITIPEEDVTDEMWDQLDQPFADGVRVSRASR